MRTDVWNRLFRPKLQAFIDLGHRYAQESCSTPAAQIEPLWIEMGLDIYQTVQVEAARMDPAELFREFGRDIALHGMIGLQSVLSHGTPEEVAREVRRIVKLSAGSGYIVAPTHFLDFGVPIPNICAMYEASVGPIGQRQAV